MISPLAFVIGWWLPNLLVKARLDSHSPGAAQHHGNFWCNIKPVCGQSPHVKPATCHGVPLTNWPPAMGYLHPFNSPPGCARSLGYKTTADSTGSQPWPKAPPGHTPWCQSKTWTHMTLGTIPFTLQTSLSIKGPFHGAKGTGLSPECCSTTHNWMGGALYPTAVSHGTRGGRSKSELMNRLKPEVRNTLS